MNYNITPKEIYNILRNDSIIFQIYKAIEEKEIRDGGWAFHNYEHVKNVSIISEKILRDLDFDEIACLLHDIGALQGKENHAQRSFEYSKKLFEEHNWIFDGNESILDAIQNHSSGFETDNIITLSIILADKLDIKKNRITDAGKKIKGNRQYGHIEDININININESILTITFITDNKLDFEEVNSYYFTDKVFKAIEAFSKKFNLRYNVLLNNKIWNH